MGNSSSTEETSLEETSSDTSSTYSETPGRGDGAPPSYKQEEENQPAETSETRATGPNATGPNATEPNATEPSTTASSEGQDSEPDFQAPSEDLDRVSRRLVASETVSEKEVRRAQKIRKSPDYPDANTLWRSLARLETVDRETVYRQAAQTYAFEVMDEDEGPTIQKEFVNEIISAASEELEKKMEEQLIIPCFQQSSSGLDSKKMTVFASPDPMSETVRETVQSVTQSPFDLRYIPTSRAEEILKETRSIDNEYLQRVEEDSSIELGPTFEEDDQSVVDEERLEEEINQSTLINLFEASLVEAVRDGASDLHIYPNDEGEVDFYFRVNGRLQHWYTENRMQPEAVLSVIKDNVMDVDRFVSDDAQDGFIERDIDGTRIRFRVSIMPLSTSGDIDGESIVIRVLDDRKVITDISKLGLGERAMNRFQDAINQPYGMVILTGPTGSGKSTTLVAALHQVMSEEENVITIEDPVEYSISGARQIKLSDKFGLEDALASVLRHDPDTVMVGEMRDKTTAELAIKLANTGHLTFSTLHTNDAPSAVTRLYKMNIEPFLIAYGINLVVAQRLIRTLCKNCRRRVSNPDVLKLESLGFSKEEIEEEAFFSSGPGCDACGGTGYDGRRAIAEAMYLTEELRHMIVNAEDGIDEGKIRQHAETENGMLSLQASARQVVMNGGTSVEEMMRVVNT